MSEMKKASEHAMQLINAAKCGDDDAVLNWLLGCREEINEADNTHDRYNALHYAAQNGHLGALRMLLVAGADVDAKSGECIEDDGEDCFDPGHTSLMLAARHGQSQAVELLLAAGADPHLEDAQQWTALHAAAISGNVTIAEKLLSLNVDHSVESGGRHFDEELGWYFFNTPMHCAANCGNAEIVSCLLEHGASPTECWGDGRTPMFYAAARGYAEVIRVLYKHGVDPNSRESRHEYGYFIDWTPLHYAASNGHVDAVRTLLDCGAEPRIVDSHMKQTAQEMAEDNSHDEVVRVFAERAKR